MHVHNRLKMKKRKKNSQPNLVVNGTINILRRALFTETVVVSLRKRYEEEKEKFDQPLVCLRFDLIGSFHARGISQLVHRNEEIITYPKPPGSLFYTLLNRYQSIIPKI